LLAQGKSVLISRALDQRASRPRHSPARFYKAVRVSDVTTSSECELNASLRRTRAGPHHAKWCNSGDDRGIKPPPGTGRLTDARAASAIGQKTADAAETASQPDGPVPQFITQSSLRHRLWEVARSGTMDSQPVGVGAERQPMQNRHSAAAGKQQTQWRPSETNGRRRLAKRTEGR
jgi:hypothetical protein